jgi:hypothetical protein
MKAAMKAVTPLLGVLQDELTADPLLLAEHIAYTNHLGYADYY